MQIDASYISTNTIYNKAKNVKISNVILFSDIPLVIVLYAHKNVMRTYDANPGVTMHVFFINGTEFTPTCSNGECNLPYVVNEDIFVTYGTGTVTELVILGRFTSLTFYFIKNSKSFLVFVKMCTQKGHAGYHLHIGSTCISLFM